MSRGRLLVIFLAVLLAACSRGPAPAPVPSSPPPPPVSAADHSDEEEIPLGPPKLELLEAGREPRTKLRRTARPGDVQTSLIGLDAHMRIDAGPSGPKELDAPDRLVLLDLRVEEVLADGSVRYGLLVGPYFGHKESPTPRPYAHGSLTVDARGVATRYAVAVVDDDGKPRSRALSGPVGIVSRPREPPAGFDRVRTDPDLNLLRELGTALVPLPDAALGVGARWRETVEVAAQGVRVTRVTTFELTGVDAQGASARATSTIGSTSGSLETAAGHELRVLDMEGSSSSEIRLAFDRLLPESVGTSELKGHVESEGKKIALSGSQSYSARTAGTRGPGLFEMDPATRLVDARWTGLGPCRSFAGDRSGPFTSAPLSGTCTAGLPDGQWTQRADDGRVLGRFDLKAGTGTVAVWWPKGSQRIEGGFKGGVPDGPVATWFENGLRQLEGAFTDGWKSGVWTEWSVTGAVDSRVFFDPACRIVEPDDGSPAGTAGLEPGDMITELSGRPIVQGRDVVATLTAAPPGPVKIVVERQGKSLTFEVTPMGAPPRLGVRLVCFHDLAPRAAP